MFNKDDISNMINTTNWKEIYQEILIIFECKKENWQHELFKAFYKSQNDNNTQDPTLDIIVYK